MSPTLIIAIVTVVLALVLYSVGVWGQWLARRLKVWHLVFFWAGFVFDVISTLLMGSIAGGLNSPGHRVYCAIISVILFCTPRDG